MFFVRNRKVRSRKFFLFLFLLVSFISSAAMSDSTKLMRFKGIQASFGFIYSGPYTSLTLVEYKNLISDDPILYADHSGFQSSSFSGNQFMAGLSIRAILDLKQKGKRAAEVFLGLKFFEEPISFLSYNKVEYEILDIYQSQNGSPDLFKVEEKTHYYSYELYCSQAYLQFGYNLRTDKRHWIWFTAGLELAPGLSYNFRYTGTENLNTIETIVAGSTPAGTGIKQYDYTTQKVQNKSSQQVLAGKGFLMIVSTPLSMNIRLGKKQPVLKNINLSTSLSPMVRASSDKFAGSSIKYGFNAELSLRVNW